MASGRSSRPGATTSNTDSSDLPAPDGPRFAQKHEPITRGALLPSNGSRKRWRVGDLQDLAQRPRTPIPPICQHPMDHVLRKSTNPSLVALYSQATDLGKDGEWAIFKTWRNDLEHRFLRSASTRWTTFCAKARTHHSWRSTPKQRI